MNKIISLFVFLMLFVFSNTYSQQRSATFANDTKALRAELELTDKQIQLWDMADAELDARLKEIVASEDRSERGRNLMEARRNHEKKLINALNEEQVKQYQDIKQKERIERRNRSQNRIQEHLKDQESKEMEEHKKDLEKTEH